MTARPTHQILLATVICLLSVSRPLLCAPPLTIDNGYFRVAAENGAVTSLQVDPTGKHQYGPNWVLNLGFAGQYATPQTKVTVSGNVMTFTGLQCEVESVIEVKNGAVPDLLTKGHTLGQSFRVTGGTFAQVEVQIPTWNTEDSGATLSLRKDGPNGEVIARRSLKNVVDNSWQELALPPTGPGIYYVELSEPHGQIGWWSSRKRKYTAGVGYVDGKPQETVERGLRVSVNHSCGVATTSLSLQGSQMKAATHVVPSPGGGQRSWPLEMRLKWDNTGYEVSSHTVPFSRFFTDTMRYMPTQQFKRWKQRNGHYELTFSGCGWVEAGGTGTYSLRFHGRDVGLSWLLHDQTATLDVPSAAQPDGASVTNELTVEARPGDDTVPDTWPEFVFADRAAAHDANTFFYERAFSYPPVWGPAGWFEWNPLARAWQTGSSIAPLRDTLSTYPMQSDGYVNTWGASPGWPFPDNKKYDTRHFDTNARFILGCWRYAMWTGDTAFLRAQAERLRRAMEYQLTALHGQDGLIVTASKDVTGRHKGVGDNYWDILPFGHLDAYANIVWYASIEAMAQIEETLTAAGVTTAVPAHPPAFYRELSVKARDAYNRTFWDDKAGRYIGCVDVDGQRHDYGFTFINLEAMAHGLADAEQARRIYHWMETEPTSTGKPDTYSAWIFAPRANTLHDPRWDPEHGKLDPVPQDPWWHFGWRGTAYGDQCQDGGAILYTSYFDLMARTEFLGPDNAWQRWQEIIARWKMPDHLCGGAPLYRGEHPQQINPGAVGVDIPFPESGMVPCWLLYGVLGAQPCDRGLVITPRLPTALPYIEVRNVSYHGLLLDIRADRREVLIKGAEKGRPFVWRHKLDSHGQVVFTGLLEGGR